MDEDAKAAMMQPRQRGGNRSRCPRRVLGGARASASRTRWERCASVVEAQRQLSGGGGGGGGDGDAAAEARRTVEWGHELRDQADIGRSLAGSCARGARCG